jgi:PIF1-like helicase/helix-turn-helix protein
MSFELSEIAKTATKYINTTDRHIFLTGKAGTGKTTFLKHIVNHTHKKAVVAAPTGIAAINANGVTLHSLLQLPFGAFIPDRIAPPNVNVQVTTLLTLFKDMRFNASKRNLIQELELLIIDEVSMLRSDLLDCIDHTLRFLRKRKDEPFGGLQLLFIGDLLQLPPVVKENEQRILENYYASSYFFDAKALENNPPLHVELDKIYRQSDQKFINLLNRFRENNQTEEDITYLNSFYRNDSHEFSSKGYIHLTTHNRKADDVNSQHLDKLDSKTYTYSASVDKEFPENAYPTALKMNLKLHAQVMFLKNDPSGEGLFFNGKIGQISKLSNDDISVKFENGEEVEVSKYSWEHKRYTLNKATNEVEEKILGSFEQYPLKLAWAVTVHKSQGLTFEKAILDLSGSFAQGQIYVALSRLTSLDGLILSSSIPQKGFEISESMKGFTNTRASLDQLSKSLDDDRRHYLQKLITRTFSFSEVIGAMKFHEQSFDKQENRSLKQQYDDWTKELFGKVYSIKEVGKTFVHQASRIMHEQPAYLEILQERIEKATSYFLPILQNLIEELENHDKGLKEKTKIKGYRKELKELILFLFNKSLALTKTNLLIKSIVENKELTKQDLEQTEVLKALKAKVPKKKEDKTPTAEISFTLFKEGKTIEAIAEERGFVVGTIESHLINYIATGEIKGTELMDKTKLENILTLIDKDTKGSGEVKAKLGEEYTWSEVRIAMATYRYKASIEKR